MVGLLATNRAVFETAVLSDMRILFSLITAR